MSAHLAAKPVPTRESEGPTSIALITVAAIICGLGIFGVFYWIYTTDWIYFPSVALVAIGCYLLFTRITGPDHA